MQVEPEPSLPETSEPYQVRITNHGRIQAWVEFALDFFEKNPERPLTLHTLPVPNEPSKDKQPENAHSSAEPTQSTSNPKQPSRMNPAMSTVPRLISVAEIIKREYLKKLDAANAEAGSLSGLHQYNELGTLEDAAPSKDQDQEQARLDSLAFALQGKNHLKIRKTAYMKITLCRKQIPNTRGVTHQSPARRNLSKSVKNRLKRRLKKEQEQSAT